MPNAPTVSSPADNRQREGRQPLRQRPHDLHALRRQVERDADEDRQHDGDQDGGNLRQPAAQYQDRDEGDRAHGRRRRDDLPVDDALPDPGDVPEERVRVDREAEELRQLADDDRQGKSVHVAEDRRLRQQVRDEAELADTGHDHQQPGDHREAGGEQDCSRRVSARAGEGQDRGRDHRAKGRVRAEDEDLRRAEDGVRNQAEHRRVEPRHRWQARELCVRHPLRHEKGRKHETGNDVL
jgi:hypothetical protein